MTTTGLIDLTNVPLSDLLSLDPEADDALSDAIRHACREGHNDNPEDAVSAFNSAL